VILEEEKKENVEGFTTSGKMDSLPRGKGKRNIKGLKKK